MLSWQDWADFFFTISVFLFLLLDWCRPPPVVQRGPPKPLKSALRQPGTVRRFTALMPGSWPERTVVIIERPYRVRYATKWIEREKHFHDFNLLPTDECGRRPLPTIRDMCNEDSEYGWTLWSMVDEGIVRSPRAGSNLMWFPLQDRHLQYLRTTGIDVSVGREELFGIRR